MKLGFAGNVVRAFGRRGWKGTLPYALGRFRTVRSVYSSTLGVAQSLGAVPGLLPGAKPVVEGLEPLTALEGLRRDAVTPLLRLPPDILTRVRSFSLEGLWKAEGTRIFRLDEVVDGRLEGHPLVLADCVDPDGCPELRRVATDPQILSLLEGYLGYRPVGVRARILYSWAVPYSKEERDAAGQTVDHHFDVESYNFVYANFYLTDVDERSGAHVMMDGSHKDKPFAWLLGSARQTDAAVLGYYGPERERIILGSAGTGFLQDSSCYHKALAPLERDRVLLQFRYY